MVSSSITTRPNGKYLARYRDATGRERSQTFAKGRKADAKHWLADRLSEMRAGTWVDPDAGKVTFRVWFEKWSGLKVWAEGTLVAATQAAESVTFADVPMAKISVLHVEQWVKSMTLPSGDRATGLAATTIRMRYSYVHMAFKGAVRARVIAVDPSAGVVLPKVRRAEMAMDERLPTDTEVGEVLAELEGDPFRAFVAVCAFAGLRLGEAAGLQVGDIDFLRKTITVSRQVQGASEAGSTVVPPKHGSERTVHVPEALTLLLSRHVGEIGVWGDEDWLFGVAAEVRFNRNSAGNQWRRVRKIVGLSPKTTLHSLRHYYASGLIAAGCDVVTVQRAMGHASADITLKVYAHLWSTAEDKTRAASAGLMAAVFADQLRTGRAARSL